MSESRMLVVLAHPDDETFGLGGTLALYAKRGVKIHLICATRGEVGTVAPEFMEGYSSIADLRVDELRCAADHLGLEEISFLDYRDSGMQGTEDNEHPRALANASLDDVSKTLVGHIRRIKPQVVVTFDPAGGYGHPDHIAMNRATSKAYEDATDPQLHPEAGPVYRPQKLYYATLYFRFAKLIVAVVRLLGKDPSKFGRNQDVDLNEVFAIRFPVNARVNYREVADIKNRALSCHASQLDFGPSSQGFVGLLFRLVRGGTSETFMRADPPVTDGRVERDLFDGVRVETSA